MAHELKAYGQPGPGTESEIQNAVDAHFDTWRAAKLQTNPHTHITVADELTMRRCIRELECVRRGSAIPPASDPISPAAWEARTYLDAQQNTIKEAPWRIKGLVVDGAATQVSAHPHGMKSLSWLHAALESVALHTVWAHFDASRVERVLFVESEDPEWLVAARIRGIAKGLGLPADKDVPGFHFICPGPFDLIHEEATLRAYIVRLKPDFVVLSTLQSVLGGRDWLTQKDMQDVNALIVRLSRICPLVVLTHSPWNPKQRRAAGTITQFANFATTLHYEKSAAINGITSLHVVVDSKVGASIDNFHLQLRTEGDETDPSSVRGLFYGGEGRPRGAGRDAVLRVLEENPGASNEEIADCASVSSRYVREIKKEKRNKSRRGQTKSSRHSAHQEEIDPNDPRLDMVVE